CCGTRYSSAGGEAGCTAEAPCPAAGARGPDHREDAGGVWGCAGRSGDGGREANFRGDAGADGGPGDGAAARWVRLSGVYQRGGLAGYEGPGELVSGDGVSPAEHFERRLGGFEGPVSV